MNPITVSADRIAERDDWERRYKANGCNLNEALFMCMCSGAPMTDFMISKFEEAISEYSAGKYEDLAEAFGIKESKRDKQATKKREFFYTTRNVVDYFSENGFNKTDPSQYDNTAFHKAGKALNKAPSTLFKTYYSGE